MFQSVIINLLWILVGYFVGSINFSIILTSLDKKKENIRNVGSKNAGATNALRVYGWKFGLVVFVLDTSKSFWFAFTLGMLQSNFEQFNFVIPQLATLFVIIGHIFPIYFEFKGGKGAATLLGMFASISLILTAIGTILFLLVVLVTKYVSLGSIIVPYWLAILSFVHPYFNGWYDSAIHYGPFWVTPIILLIACVIVTLSHHENIKRLFLGKENRIKFSFLEKDLSKNA